MPDGRGTPVQTISMDIPTGVNNDGKRSFVRLSSDSNKGGFAVLIYTNENRRRMTEVEHVLTPEGELNTEQAFLEKSRQAAEHLTRQIMQRH